jgi:polar amino acid transport system substrate-binding protein
VPGFASRCRADLVDILLTRQLKQAELIRADTVVGAFELLQSGRADVSALPRPNLLQWCAQLPGSRVLPDRFGVNLVAIAVPKGEAGRLAYVTEFIEAAKASGLVQKRSRPRGCVACNSRLRRNAISKGWVQAI